MDAFMVRQTERQMGGWNDRRMGSWDDEMMGGF